MSKEAGRRRRRGGIGLGPRRRRRGLGPAPREGAAAEEEALEMSVSPLFL